MSDSFEHSAGFRTVSLVLLLVDLLALLGMVGMVAISAPASRRFLADMGAEVPSLTRTFLSIPLWGYVAGLGALAVVLLVKELLLRPAVRMAVNLVVLPIVLLAAGAYVYSIVMPVMDMMQCIQ